MLTFVGHYANPKMGIAHPEYLEVLKEKLGLTTIDAAAREGFVFGCDIYVPSLSMSVGHRYSDYKKFSAYTSPLISWVVKLFLSPRMTGVPSRKPSICSPSLVCERPFSKD